MDCLATSSKPLRRAEAAGSLETSEDIRDHPAAGRRRRHKSPAVAHDTHGLALPSLPDHLRTDADGPTSSHQTASV